ncbi:MAG: DinB family protein [Fimbriimonas sp.]
MRYQDYITDQVKAAAEEVFRYARAVPEDKLEWSPEGKGRSVLDIMREVARTPTWAYELIDPEAKSDFSEEGQAKEKEAMDALKTLDDCRAEFDRGYARLAEVYRAVPDERLSETKWLPFDGGRDFTVTEMMDYPRWNYNYHLGQIGYIQILFGDKEMH